MNQNDTYGQPKKASGIALAFTGTAAASAAISSCSCVRLLTTSDCFIEITELGTLATTAGMYLPAYQAEYLYIPPNGKVSAIQVSAAGTLYITPFIS